MTSDVFVLVPAYNEGAVLRQTILSIVDQYSVVLIDDASTDDTAWVVADLPIYYLRHPINLGQGAALQTGMDFACQEGASIVVHFDADGQHNPRDIPRFIEKLNRENVDIVLGSRFLRAADRALVPVFKRLILNVARIVNGLLTGLWLTDAHNGFRVMNKRSLRAIHFKENRMAHATEILAQIRKHKLHYVELDTKIIYTDHSKFKGQSWTNSLNILFDLFVNRYFR